MKKITFASFLVVATLLAGCATTFRPWQLSNVHEGMDKAAVIKLLGNPNQTSIKNNAEYLHYSYTEGQLPEPPSGNALSGDANMQTLQKKYKIYRYDVMLVDGKVINYKEVQD